MSSAARALANRVNAQASTGPRSQEGKAASRLNGVTHSMTSNVTVLPHESQQEYDSVLQGLVDGHKPATENERLLVERLAQAHWRLQRCYNVERAFLDNRIAAAQEESPDIDPHAAMAQMFVDKAEAARMRLMMRYLGAAERAFYKAEGELAKAQTERRKRAAEEAEIEALRAAYAPVGFVSHAAAQSDPPAAIEEFVVPADPEQKTPVGDQLFATAGGGGSANVGACSFRA